MRLVRVGTVMAATAAVVAATVTTAAPVSAERTTGWATWGPLTGSSNAYATTMQLPAGGFPDASVTSDSRSPAQVPSGATSFLGGPGDPVPTEVGTKYGSSRNSPYLLLRPKADKATTPSTTTYSFSAPTPGTGWAFVLGDIDSDAVRISAKDADGTPLTAAQIAPWFQGVFNYLGDADLPSWDQASSTLTGNPGALDTNAASAWFEPDLALSTLTFTFTRRAGFPVYQTWFASVARTISGTVTDVSLAGATCPVTAASVRLLAPDGRLLASTRPAADGSYDLGQYATQPGYTVQVERPDGCAVVGSAQHTVSTARSDATADFSLRHVVPQSVSGTVTTRDGSPVAGVEITLTPPGGGPPRTTTTDADGRYLFDDNAEQDGYTVAVTGVPDGYDISGPGSRSFDIPHGTPVTGQDFTLVELPSVSGTVTGGGAGLPGATVTLTPRDGGTSVTTVTRGDGSYVFEHVPAGEYDIAVTPPDGYRPSPPRTGVTVAGSDVPDEDFALTRPGSLGGQVTQSTVGGGSQPVPAAIVTVSGPGVSRTLQTDTDGSYFLDDLDPGNYTITLTVPDGLEPTGPTTRTVMITDAGENRGGQDFVLEAAATTTSPTSSPTSTSPTSSPTSSTSAPSTSTGTPTVPPVSGGAGSGSSLASGTSGLAYTGVQVIRLLGLITLLVAGGTALLGAARRRAAHQH